jgi:hypothetical protein
MLPGLADCPDTPKDFALGSDRPFTSTRDFAPGTGRLVERLRKKRGFRARRMGARPSVRRMISFAARTLPWQAPSTMRSAITSAYVRPALSLGNGLPNNSRSAGVSLVLRGLPAGFPLVPFGHGLKFCKLATKPLPHCFLTVSRDRSITCWSRFLHSKQATECPLWTGREKQSVPSLGNAPDWFLPLPKSIFAKRSQ